MGYQLWTSPNTGYKHKGTRLSDLRSLLGAGIMARSILEPLRSCPLEASSDDTECILSERGFDVAGVRRIQDGPVIGFVLREALRGGRVKDHIKLMNAEHLISDATPLGELLTVLRESVRM